MEGIHLPVSAAPEGAEVYQVSVKTVNEHLVNIYAEGELGSRTTIRSFRVVQREGSRDVTRSIDHHSLDILAVGYRIRSTCGTAFRQWATARLRDLLAKGFFLDDERFKEGRTLGADYFDDLIERIRDIRASERMFYQKITDMVHSRFYVLEVCDDTNEAHRRGRKWLV